MNMARSYNRLWDLYSKKVGDGSLPSIVELLQPAKSKSQRRHFVSTGQQHSEDAKNLLTTFWEDNYAKFQSQKDTKMENQNKSEEEKIFELGMELLNAVKMGQRRTIERLLETGVPVNFQHPETKSTALHIAAAGSNLVAAQMLIKNDSLNYLLRDKWNRLAMDNAMFFSIYPEIVDLLASKTKEQAIRDGIDLKSEFRENLRQWFQQDWYNQLSQDNIYTPPEPN